MIYIKLKKFYQILSLIFFGNTLGFIVNPIYLLHNCIARIFFLVNFKKKSFLKSSLTKSNSKELKNLGLKIIGITSCHHKLKEKFRSSFDERAASDVFLDSPGYIRLNRQLYSNFLDEIIEIIESDLNNFLYSYYGSYYKIFWTSILRMCPVDGHKDDESLLWHYDDNPEGILKVFIYCSDQKEDTGAFKTFDLKTSNILKKTGFFTYTTEDRIKNQEKIKLLENKKNYLVAEGDAGSILVFQNNIIHKGNLPKIGNRDLIVLEVIPSLTKMTKDDVLYSLNKNVTVDYPKNPFFAK